MKVFYITPFLKDKKFTAKKKIVTEMSELYDITILRGAYEGKGEFDLNETIKRYYDADYFIADLSFERPSCYYESGFAQGIGKKVYFIAAEGTDIHQINGDVNYYSDLEDYKNLQDRLFKKILEVFNDNE